MPSLFTCSKCGCRKEGMKYTYKKKVYCYDCFQLVSKEEEQVESQTEVIYSYVKKLYGVSVVPPEVTYAIERELAAGKTVKGIKYTIQYYFEILGHTASADYINLLPRVIKEQYEQAREYVKKMNELKAKNEKVDINVPPVVIKISPKKLHEENKKGKISYNIEDL